MLFLSDLNYYEILGVSHNASIEEIKKKYRELSLKFHPDKTNSSLASEMMKKINEAYETLSDEQKRRNYDQGKSKTSKSHKSTSEKKSTKSVWKSQLKEMAKNLHKLWLKYLEMQRQNQARNSRRTNSEYHSSHYERGYEYDDFDDDYEEPRRPRRQSKRSRVKRTKKSHKGDYVDSWEESLKRDSEFVNDMFGFGKKRKGDDYFAI